MNATTRFRFQVLGLGLVGLLFVAGSGFSALRATAAASLDSEVKLETVKYDAMIKQIASKKAKLTVADAWATWCGPCKKNFPHLVEMHKKYAKQGIAFASISLDDTTKPAKLVEATKFLADQKADFANFVLDETQDDAFDRLDISAIPAVFMYGPDGKVVRKFTLEDPNNQFTYEQIETAIQEFLAGKPMTTGEVPRKR